MAVYRGIDADQFPGLDALGWLKANADLSWAGMYLAPAPSHRDTGWMGQRAGIAALGLGVVPVFLGQQTTGLGSHAVNGIQGTTDGDAAAALMTQEGFAAGSYVYLDLENGPPLTLLQAAYVKAWAAAVTAKGWGVGLYVSHLLATQVQGLANNPRLWCFRVVGGALEAAAEPSGCGFWGATAWQFSQDQHLAAGAHSIFADFNSSTMQDPSAP